MFNVFQNASLFDHRLLSLDLCCRLVGEKDENGLDNQKHLERRM